MLKGNAMNRPVACLLVALALSSAAAAKDLVGVYEDALKSDPQIRQADANRLASREARPQAWAALLPQISGALTRSQDKQDGSVGNTNPVTGAPAPGSEAFGQHSPSKAWGLNLRENRFAWSN